MTALIPGDKAKKSLIYKLGTDLINDNFFDGDCLSRDTSDWMAFANLHMHTYFSDGCISPEDLIRLIYNEKELKIFALTDHDTLSGIEPVFRAKKRMEFEFGYDSKRFIPGIELSLRHRGIDRAVHLIGLFPMIDENNFQTELIRLDRILGPFCTYRSRSRAIKDLDGRIYRAFDLNLDGVREFFENPETVINILRNKAQKENEKRFRESGKKDDIIQYPIPATYQVIIEHWEDLVPASSKEKISLYAYLPDRSKMERLIRIYQNEGMRESDAINQAQRNQGSLTVVKNTALKEMEVHEGLNLLKTAEAVTFLAHPAGDHEVVTYEAFDRNVLYPLIENGLDGIEVYYPYDHSHRKASTGRYLNIARQHGLLISGGTDFHGDGRTSLSDIRFGLSEAEKIASLRK